eukprot:g5969.t1
MNAESHDGGGTGPCDSIDDPGVEEKKEGGSSACCATHGIISAAKPSSAAAANGDDGDDDDNEEEECKICRCPADEDMPLVAPCLCKGSIRWVHDECLTSWLKVNRQAKCELCGYSFIFRPIYRPGTPAILPARDVVTAAVKTAVGWVPFFARSGAVVALWFVVLPVGTCFLYRMYSNPQRRIFLPPPPTELSAMSLLQDMEAGLVAAICAIVAFLALMAFVDFYRWHEEMDQAQQAQLAQQGQQFVDDDQPAAAAAAAANAGAPHGQNNNNPAAAAGNPNDHDAGGADGGGGLELAVAPRVAEVAAMGLHLRAAPSRVLRLRVERAGRAGRRGGRRGGRVGLADDDLLQGKILEVVRRFGPVVNSFVLEAPLPTSAAPWARLQYHAAHPDAAPLGDVMEYKVPADAPPADVMFVEMLNTVDALSLVVGEPSPWRVVIPGGGSGAGAGAGSRTVMEGGRGSDDDEEEEKEELAVLVSAGFYPLNLYRKRPA